MRPPFVFPVAESSDLKAPHPVQRARSRMTGPVVRRRRNSHARVCLRSEPDGGDYGRWSVHRVTYETRHLYLHETCQRERGRRDLDRRNTIVAESISGRLNGATSGDRRDVMTDSETGWALVPVAAPESPPARAGVTPGRTRAPRPRTRAARTLRVGRARAHSMTSSARTRKDCGIVSPSALAVLRLMTNSNFVGCSMGSSAGFAPFRILSTK